MSTKNEQTQNINNEIIWHDKNPWIQKDHFLMKWPFRKEERQAFIYKVVRENVKKELQDYLAKNSIKIPKALIAPCGGGGDLDILEGMADEFYGVDISPKAVEECSSVINKKLGDVRETGYESDYFDAVASFQFFHHLHKPGFDPYVKELHRVLKKGGLLITFEPGLLYPLGWFMLLGRKIFGNISGLVPDEAPILPSKFNKSLKGAGFKVEGFQSLSFSHPRIPIPMQKIIDFCFNPLRKVLGINQMGFMLMWICKKV